MSYASHEIERSACVSDQAQSVHWQGKG